MSSTATGRELTLWRWGLIALGVWAVGYLLFVKEPWLMREIVRERDDVRAVLGKEAAERAEARATRIWEAVVVNTGAIDATFRLIAPGTEADKTDRAVNAKLVGARGMVETRLRVMWSLLYQLLVRLCVASLWWTYGCALLIPCVVDAMVSRRVRATGFGYTSPTAYVAGRHVMFVLPLVAIATLVAPVVLPSAIIPVFVVVLCGSTWLSISMFAKRA